MKLFPLTHPQRRIWDAERAHPGTSMWNNAGTLKIRGELDFGLLDRAIQLFVSSNDSLRIRIHVEDGVPQQYVAAYRPFYIEQLDFSDQGVKGLYEWDVRQTQAPMPLIDSPLFYIAMAKTAPDEGYVYAKLHHIISDGVSFVLFANEIMENYDRLLDGQEPQVAKRTSYLEYVAEEQAYLDSPRYAYDEAYWLDLFADYPEPTVLKQRTSSFVDTRSRRKACVLSTELSDGLNEFCDKNRISPFCLLLAAFSVYLNRVTGKRDLVMSAPVSNRTFAGASERFGMYVNTVPLRIRIDDDDTFMDLLGSVSEQWFSMLKHQRYPYDVLVQKVHARSRDSEPLYDLSLSYQIGTFVKDQRHFSYEGRWHFSGHQTMSLAIHLNDRESSGRYILDYDYQTQLFTSKSVDFVHEHLCDILEDVIAHPDRHLGQLHMLSDAEYNKVVWGFNGCDEPDASPRAADRSEAVSCEKVVDRDDALDGDVPGGDDLVGLWNARVASAPDDEALVFHGKTWSVASLDARARDIASRLLRAGAVPGSVVALLLPRSDLYVAALLGVLKMGGAFMPIDVSLPAERVAYMMQEAAARFAIGGPDPRVPQGTVCVGATEGCIADARDGVGATGDGIGATGGGAGDAEAAGELPAIAPSMLAYIIYTSGSTGAPKGVMIEHRSIAHFALVMRGLWGRSAGGRMLCAGPTCFDLSVMEICIGLLGGRSLVIADEQEADYPERLCGLILGEHVDLMMVTPGRMQLLLSSHHAAEALRGLREIGLGADVLSPALIKSIHGLTSAHVTNFYGPTEATIAATACDLSESEDVTIGRPLPGVHVYILDPHGNPVPISVPGELAIGGKGVARGYMSRDELTAERFMPSPFIEGERLYRTGDLARWYPRGEIALLGRIDQQVKIRGYRIELGEIANRLREIDGVDDAAVVCYGEAGEHRYLCGYVVGDEAPDASSLKERLAKTLPFYMIPAYLLHLESIPLTVNGKLDRAALPRPADVMGEKAETGGGPGGRRDGATQDGAAQDGAAQDGDARDGDGREGDGNPQDGFTDDRQRKLASIWTDILEVPIRQRDAHFLQMGGDSLSMVRMVAQVSEAFDVELRLEDVYAQPTLAHCAQLIEQAQRDFRKPVRPVGRRRSYPATPTQQRMYALTRRDPATLRYNVPCAFTFHHRLDEKRLRHALQLLLRRHGALVTSLQVQGGRIVQQLNRECDVPFRIVEGEDADRRRLIGEAVRPFDVSRAPLMRLVLVRTPGGDTLVFDFHHAVCDQRSLELVLEDLSALYVGDELPVPQVDYKDCAVWYDEYLDSGAVAESSAFWHDALARPVPPLALPAKGRRTGLGRGAQKTIHIDAERLQTLQSFVQQRGSTTFSAVLCAFALVLSREAATDQLMVGVPVIGRFNAAMQRVVGAFVNTLPLRCDVSDRMTVAEYFQRTARVLSDALAHQDLPFERIVAQSGSPRDADRNPLFDVMLVMGRGDVTFSLDGENSVAQVVPTKTSKLDVTLYVQELAGGFDLRLEYDTDLFSAAAALRTLKRIAYVLETLYVDPDMQLACARVLPDDEYRLVTETFSATDKVLPTVYPQQRISELAQRRPHDTAVVCADATLDFLELKRRSDVIARALQDAGADRGCVVGVMLHRNSDLMPALFGTMFSGAAWLPIDPSLPSERRAFMLSDGGATLLIRDGSQPGEPLVCAVHGDGSFDAGTPALLGVASDAAYAPDATRYALPDLDDIAYLIYTSGSTGVPKASMLPWRGVTNLLGALDDRVGYAPSWTCVSITTISFDIFIADSIIPLCDGCRLVLADDQSARQPALLAGLIEGQKVDFLQATPSRMQFLMHDRRFREAAASHLATVVLAGEKPVLPLVRQLKRLLPGTRLLNGYGPSEVTVYTSFQDMSSSSQVSIGWPLANTHVYILDGQDRPVPLGTLGEACISGPGVSTGYRGRADLNASKFLPDPFRKGLTLYRSGDLCSFSPKGEIFIHGRTDQQVKIRGLRIEPAEIEAALASLPGIDEAAVCAFGEGEHRYLCAFYVSAAARDERDLRRLLANSLPSYMVPGRFMHLDSLPTSPNGKVDRAALPRPAGPDVWDVDTGTVEMDARKRKDAGGAGSARRAAVSSDERRFLRVVAKVLKTGALSPDDDLFQLGGDSLSIILIQARMLEQGFSLRTQDFYDEPTLGTIFQRARKVGKPGSVEEARGIMDDMRERNRESRDALASSRFTLPAVPLERVLVTGATGFLGAHMVEALLKAGAQSVVCLVRGDEDADATRRLRQTLEGYGIGEASGRGNRAVVTAVSGDVTAIENRIGSLADVTAIIHTAALTEHVGRRSDFEQTNVQGTRHVIDLALRVGCPLVHISTLSVAGTGLDQLDEGCFDFGQDVSGNEYVRSKFLAEGLVLDAVSEGLDARIMRMGNLTGRQRDGVFQRDVHRNAFAMRLAAMVRLGCYPQELETRFDITPVDLAARAVVALLAARTRAHRIFHLRGRHDLSLRELAGLLGAAGYPVAPVSTEEFSRRALEAMAHDPAGVFGVVRDLAEGDARSTVAAAVSSEETERILKSLGFTWPDVTPGYLGSYLQHVLGEGEV